MSIISMGSPVAVTGRDSVAQQDISSPSPRKEVGRRRKWSLEEKATIIAETEQPGETIASVARRHDMHANHLLDWIERAKAGTLGKRGAKRRTPASDAVAEGGFVELGRFSREEVNEVLGFGGPMEVMLANGLKVRLSVSTPPEMLTRAVRALQAV